MYYVGACCGNAGKQVGKSPADGDVEAANLRVTASDSQADERASGLASSWQSARFHRTL